ncbi:MAG: glycosyltransferase [Proteobacteria bacterium]|nr:glycosyltransferase [Pseudomonadota bacterium]
MSEAVSLYIPCYNGAEFLPCVLPAVLDQTLAPAEILVVDDGSTDRSRLVIEDFARRSGGRLRLVPHAQNRGLGAARNTGVRTSVHPFVAALDADVVPEPTWLEECMRELQDPQVVGVGGDLVEDHCHGMANHWRATHMRQSRGDQRVENPPFLWGSNSVFRRQALFDAGLYDERCRTNGEDVPLSRALAARQRRLVFTPRARCHHLRRDSVRSILDTYWRWRFYGNWHRISLAWTLKQNKGNFKYWPLLWRQDWRARDWSNLALDTVLPFYRTARDWQTYFRGHL